MRSPVRWLCTRTPTSVSALAYASVTVLPASRPPPLALRRPTMSMSRSATSAFALPLLLAGNAVAATLTVSPDLGIPLSCNSQPFKAMGWPATQAAEPLDTTVLLPSRSAQS